MSESVTARAYAKINWGLELLRKREDGYHEIRTLTHTISLCDELTVALRLADITLTVSGDWPAPEDPTNLCRQAAEAFREAFGTPAGLSIHLHKRIPVATGLGGGSSDCVATLMALSHLTGAGSLERLSDIAASLGSDTTLFLTGGAALCSGRGEIVTPIRCPRSYDLVIARPDRGVSTREAYGLISGDDLSDGSAMDALAAALERGESTSRLGGILQNAFRAKVTERFPEIEDLAGALLDAGALAAEMTGSGSGVFGLVEDAAAARDLAEAMAAQGYWAIAARTVDSGYEFTEASAIE